MIFKKKKNMRKIKFTFIIKNLIHFHCYYFFPSIIITFGVNGSVFFL